VTRGRGHFAAVGVAAAVTSRPHHPSSPVDMLGTQAKTVLSVCWQFAKEQPALQKLLY